MGLDVGSPLSQAMGPAQPSPAPAGWDPSDPKSAARAQLSLGKAAGAAQTQISELLFLN